jgi:hypothetical protein
MLLILSIITLSIMVMSTIGYIINITTINCFELIIISAIWYKIFTKQFDEIIKPK